jgi:hypothetical protein
MKHPVRVGGLCLGLGSLMLAACGSTATTGAKTAQVRPLAPNYATVLETNSGDLFAEAQSYQHGQVLEAKNGVLRLMTPEGVSTRGGVSLALTPGGSTAWAAVIAQLELYVSPIYVGPIGSWKAAELTTAVAPYPGSVLPMNSTKAVAIVGSKAHGARHQELVQISSSGTIGDLLATSATLNHLGSQANCLNPVYESLVGPASSPTLLASCANASRVEFALPLAGTFVVRTPPKGSSFVGLSQLVDLPGSSVAKPVAAAVLASNGTDKDRVELVGSLGSSATALLDGRPISAPSVAASGNGVWVLVPLAGGKSQLIAFSPTGAVASDVAGPKQAQGLGLSLGGHPLVISANPNANVITLWRLGSTGFVKTGSFTVPEGVN